MMKPSYFTTPRTMSEAVFLLNCDPIELPESRADTHIHWVTLALLGASLIGGLISLVVSL